MQLGMETERNATASACRKGRAFSGRRIHLIGIGGCGMRALAGVLLQDGAVVSGSDMADGAGVRKLTADGAKVCVGQRPENLPADCEIVVHSAAIHPENPELVAARQRGLEVLKYSQMLGRLMDQEVGIAVAGTHGKSTTTAMVAYVLTAAGAEPSFIVGATVEQLGGPSGVGRGKHFVAEACEYDRSFLNLSPHYAAILNIDEDHLDCYSDLEAIVEAFRAFVSRIKPGGVLVANGEDREVTTATQLAACEVETFGLAEDCTWRGQNATADRGRYTLDVTVSGDDFCRLVVPLPGLHNAYNALAATALLYHAGMGPGKIAELLATFTGAHRRMTFKGRVAGVTVLDDYAHHPREIQASLRAIRDHYQPRRLICVFQPHQHSRTRFLLKDFAASFGLASEVLVPDIYFVRDSDRERDYISSQDLVAQIRLRGGSAQYLESFERIAAHLAETLTEGDLVVTMGAGNIWEVADDVVRRVQRDR